MIGILAQSGAGDLPGLPGAGTILGTSLLAGVLAWLMFVHLPATFKFFRDEMAGKDALVTKLVDNFREEMRQERETHDADLKAQREEAMERDTRLGDLLLANTSETRLLSASVTNLAQQAGLVIPPPGK